MDATSLYWSTLQRSAGYLRILVDDDAHYREAVSAELADFGFDVACFGDADTFLEGLDRGAVAEVVLLDWALPGRSGFDVIECIRERGMELPIVFLTGNSQVELDVESQQVVSG